MIEDDGRVEIPLRMLDGNLHHLLNNRVDCEGIELKWDEASVHGVILIVHFGQGQAEKAHLEGFHTESRGR